MRPGHNAREARKSAAVSRAASTAGKPKPTSQERLDALDRQFGLGQGASSERRRHAVRLGHKAPVSLNGTTGQLTFIKGQPHVFVKVDKTVAVQSLSQLRRLAAAGDFDAAPAISAYRAYLEGDSAR